MESLKEKRKIAKRNKMKKAIIATSLAATLTVGTGATYASDTTIGTKIQEFMTAVVNGLIPGIEAHMETETTRIKGEISKTTTDEMTAARTGLESYAGTQKQRITTELNAYRDAKVLEVRDAVGNSSHKKNIEDAATASINTGKAAIDAEVAKALSGK